MKIEEYISKQAKASEGTLRLPSASSRPVPHRPVPARPLGSFSAFAALKAGRPPYRPVPEPSSPASQPSPLLSEKMLRFTALADRLGLCPGF